MSYDYFYGQSGELFSYFRIPKALFQDHRFRQLSTDARTLYGILLDRMSLSAKNGWLDEQGRVYIIYTVREVQDSLCCAEHKAVKLFRELEDMDLIERKRRGLGRPSLIYVKDFSSGLPKAQVQNCPNSNSGAAESAILEQPKPQANKTDKNKTEWNDPDPIYSGGIREQLEDYFYQALEVDLLLRLCPDDEDTIYQIVDLLVDTCSTKRKMLWIAGDDKPAEVVRSRLKKLNADHMHTYADGHTVKEVRPRYSCFYKIRHPGDCDGQSGYGVSKLDSIVEEVVRQIFAQFREVSRKKLLESVKTNDAARIQKKIKKIQKDLEAKQKELDDLKAETILVIRGVSALDKELLGTLVAEAKDALETLEKQFVQAQEEYDEATKTAKRSNYICNELFTWADVYDTANHDERRAILQQFIKEIRVRKGYEISITLNASFDQVEQLKAVSTYDGAGIFEEISEKGA